MQNMQVEFGFKKLARLKESLRVVFLGKVHTFLTENNIIQIWNQYNEQRLKEQLHSKQPLVKDVPKKGN